MNSETKFQGSRAEDDSVFHDGESESKKTIFISEATPDDAGGIAKTLQQVWKDTYIGQTPGLTEADIPDRMSASTQNIEKFRQVIENQSDEQHIWVAKDTDVVGFCWAVKANGENEIKQIYIQEGYQGRRIGLRLMNTAMQWFGPGQDVILLVEENNYKRAIPFYEKYGFQRTNDAPLEKAQADRGEQTKILRLIKMVRKATK